MEPDLALDRQRVGVLLQINALLLHRCLTAVSRAEYARRLHCNLACLAAINDAHQPAAAAKPPLAPAILAPPADCPELAPLYAQLRLLYGPGQSAQHASQSQSQSQPQPQSQHMAAISQQHTPQSVPASTLAPAPELSPEQILARASSLHN